MRLIYFVDGDNNPPAGTEGIEKLTEEDEVIVFYARNNTYYGKAAKRDSLMESAKCSLRFVEVVPGKDAVDFAIAIAAAKLCAREPAMASIYLFVSKDKHFDIVQRQLRDEFGDDRILKRVDTIEEGISRFFVFKIGGQNDLSLLLQRQYGRVPGQWLYHQIKEHAGAQRRNRGAERNMRRLFKLPMKKSA